MLLSNTMTTLRARRMPNALCWLLGAAALLLTAACGPSAPAGIIQPDEMEDLLYDYHLADAMTSHALGGTYEQNVVSYHTSVFKKYGVTSAQFDSSMVYYMRHTSDLHDMYEHIAKRLEDEAQAAGSMVSTAVGAYAQAQGDTLDIWNNARSLVLIPNEPYNLVSFHLAPDDKAKPGDDYVLSMHSNFIFQDGMRDAVVVLALVYKGDSVASRVMHVSSSTDQQMVLTDGDSLGVKEVRGYFLLARNNQVNSSSTTLKLVSFDRIRLLRCHRQTAADANKPKADKDYEDSEHHQNRQAAVKSTVPQEAGEPATGHPRVASAALAGSQTECRLMPQKDLKLAKPLTRIAKQ